MLTSLFPFRQKSFDDTLSLLKLYALARERELGLPLALEVSDDASPLSAAHPLPAVLSRSRGDTGSSLTFSKRESRVDAAGDRESLDGELSLFSFVPLPQDREEGSGRGASSTRSSRADPERSVSDAFRCVPTQDMDSVLEIQWGPSDGMEVILRRTNALVGRGSAGRVYRGQLCFRQCVEDASTDSSSGDAAAFTLVVDVAVKIIKVSSSGGYLGDPVAVAQSVRRRLRAVHPSIVFAYFLTAFPSDPRSEKWVADLSNARTFNLALAMEIANGGSLDVELRQQERLSEETVRLVMLDILPALAYLHEEQGIVHNDVKPGNVLIFHTEGENCGVSAEGSGKLPFWKGIHSSIADVENRRVRYKLCDLGSSRFINPCCDVVARLRCACEDTLHASADGNSFKGTATFMSPESCLGIDDSPTNDVWSIGVTVFQLVTGRVPWQQLESTYPAIILNGFREKFSMGYLFAASPSTSCGSADATLSSRDSMEPSSTQPRSADLAAFGPILDEIENNAFSPEVRDFVKRCLVEIPKSRPTCQELLRHPFIRGTKLQV